jgi:hypothetical protein
MSEEKRTKLNRLISEWPRGTVSAVSYLNRQGISHALLNKYKNSRWIRPVGRGAYCLEKDRVRWTGAVWAIQTQLGLDIHPGGKTALEMKGYAHYLSEKPGRIFLYGSPGLRLPAWFKRSDWGEDIVFTSTGLFPDDCKDGFSRFDEGEFSVRISAPERAAMEMLYHVPARVSFEEALMITENLAALRPGIANRLLEKCSFIKVKRLFMYMAEKHGHPWVRHLDLSGVNFGRGKRLVAKGGVLDKNYNITVPRDEDEVLF